MQLKGEEYLKRNILAIYYKHYDEGKNFSYYRFMGKIEFETLFQCELPEKVPPKQN